MVQEKDTLYRIERSVENTKLIKLYSQNILKMCDFLTKIKIISVLNN